MFISLLMNISWDIIAKQQYWGHQNSIPYPNESITNFVAIWEIFY